MKVETGIYQGKKCTAQPGFVGGHVLKIGFKKFKLPSDIKSLRLLNKEEYRSGLELFLILLVSITVIGLIIGIPWLIVSKRQRVTAAIDLRTGEHLTATFNKQEWRIMSRYLTA